MSRNAVRDGLPQGRAGRHAPLRAEAALLLAQAGLADLQPCGPIASSGRSTVFRAETVAGQPRAVIKFCHAGEPGRPDGTDARTYFTALQQLASLARRDPLLGCAEPIRLFESQGVVIAGWVEGPTVARVLRLGSRQAICDVLRRSGEWLARLQLACGLSYRPLDTQPALLDLDELSAAQPSIARRPEMRAAAGLLRASAGAVGRLPIPWSQVCGDFKPANLMLSAGHLAAIDIALRWPGACVLDAAQFLNNAALALSFHPGGAALTARAEAEFLEGSRQAGLQLPAMPLAWARLHSLARMRIGLPSWSAPPRSWITGWSISRQIRRLAADLARLVPASEAEAVHS